MENAGSFNFLRGDQHATVREMLALPPAARLLLLKSTVWLFKLAEIDDLRGILLPILVPAANLPAVLLLALGYVSLLFQERNMVNSLTHPSRLRYPYYKIIACFGTHPVNVAIDSLRQVFREDAVFDHFLLQASEHGNLCQRLIDETFPVEETCGKRQVFDHFLHPPPLHSMGEADQPLQGRMQDSVTEGGPTLKKILTGGAQTAYQPFSRKSLKPSLV